MFCEEGTVSSIQDVNFRIGEVWILVGISGPVLMAYELGPTSMLVWIEGGA